MRTCRVNTQRRFGEAGCYVYVEIDGVPALLTEDAVEVGKARAKRQPEDLPKWRLRWLRVRRWLLG